MAVVLYILGVLSALAGLAAIAYGIPVKEFSFGNTLIESGSVAFVGGLIVVGLAAAIGQLHRVVDMLGARPLQRMGREFEGARVPFPPKPKADLKAEPPKVERAIVPPPPMAADVSEEFNPPSLPNPDVALVAQSETETAPLSPAPMPPPPRREFAPPPSRDVAPPPKAPAKTSSRSTPTLADERVRAPFEPPPKRPEIKPPAFEPPPAGDGIAPPAAESSEAPFFEPPASEPPRVPEPAGFEPPPADLPASEEPATEPPWRKPRPERPSFDEIWPAQPRAPFAAPEPPPARAAESIARASALEGEPEPERAPEPPLEEIAEPEPDRADEAPVAILKSGVVDGMGYTLYVDGSIEAELPDGTLRFASINELRAHLERNS